eukprot:s827_g5.t1
MCIYCVYIISSIHLCTVQGKEQLFIAVLPNEAPTHTIRMPRPPKDHHGSHKMMKPGLFLELSSSSTLRQSNVPRTFLASKSWRHGQTRTAKHVTHVTHVSGGTGPLRQNPLDLTIFTGKAHCQHQIESKLIRAWTLGHSLCFGTLGFALKADKPHGASRKATLAQEAA